MLIFACVVAGLIGCLAVVQCLAVQHYVRWLDGHAYAPVEERDLPPAAVVLCLRGTDPFLDKCLERLTSQCYPRYDVHVVIDHPTDPAREVVERWLTEHPDRSLRISFLREPSPQAYLKTSAIRECLESLGDEFGAAVIVDADAITYRNWLRDLVTPMVGTDVGLVTGNRWYDPTLASYGSIVRFCYNAFVLVPMYFMRATWGGSLALRREVYVQPFFAEKMQCTSSEEHAMQLATQRANLQLEVQPDVMILNREPCSVLSCFRFALRQFVWTRLYHPHWRLVVLGTLTVYVCLAAAVVAAIFAAAIGQFVAASILGGPVLFQIGLCLALIEWLHRAIAQRAARVQDELFPVMTWGARWRVLVAIPTAFLLLVCVIVCASFSRRVVWRGITYEVVPPDGIRMCEYRPYASSTPQQTIGCSVT